MKSMTNLEPKDAPKWIKLKTTATSYTKVLKIVGVGHLVNAGNIDNREITSVYTTYAEDNPWLVYNRIDSTRKRESYLIMNYLMKKTVEKEVKE
jgi:hypothetical protein